MNYSEISPSISEDNYSKPSLYNEPPEDDTEYEYFAELTETLLSLPELETAENPPITH